MDLVVTTLIGVAVGAIAELVWAVHLLKELIVTMLLAISGALLARFLGVSLGWFDVGAPASFLASGIGAAAAPSLYELCCVKRFRRKK
jgi:uncharacterized membrane protein YeaQ/YmgE (transglycosylase-associated protein family)